MTSSLEGQFQSELNVARFTRANAGGAVADAESGGDPAKIAAGARMDRRGQVPGVEDVEHLQAKLGIEAFADSRVFET
jgi:hypothetical protein